MPGRKAKKPFVPKGKVHFEVRECDGKKIAILTLDNPPMNPLSSGIRMGLDEHLKTVLNDASIDGAVITGANGAFCAGADISEFAGGMKGPNLVQIINSFEASPKPIVAAIDGVALGGGCEVSLGCHYRVATPRSMIGLPEVNLGLLPGAGGTQRLPRLIGCAKAIDVMCTAAPLPCPKAVELGVIDKMVDSNIAVAGVQLCASVIGADLSKRRLCERKATMEPGAADAARAKWAKLRRGEAAPQAIIRCAEAAATLPFGQGMKTEQKEFLPLMMGDQSKAMQYMFFAERACWKVPGLTAAPAKLRTIGVVGAGLMGGGIAMACATAGLKVVLVDADEKGLARGISVIEKNYATSVKRGSMKEKKARAARANITAGGTDLAALKDCDLVIEAVFENMDIKKKLFATLDKVCKKDCILATNTSYLSIDEIASATSRPEDVIGCHFFSPANVMKLLENVRGEKTGPRAIATAMAFGKRIGKTCVLVRSCWGFVANRMMAKQGVEQLLYKQGQLPKAIDAASESFGFRMGPMRMMDLVGLDLGAREREREGKLAPQDNAADFLYSKGNYGMKNGKGYYVYDEKRRATPNPEIEAYLADLWKRKGVAPRQMTNEQIVEQIYFPVINEGFRCLEEGIVMRPSDIDVALVYGYGFPRFRGGPMKYADLLGLEKVVKGLKEMGEQPCALLQKLVDDDMSLQRWAKKQEKAAAQKAKL